VLVLWPPAAECDRLIAGPGVFICDRCVARASGLSAAAAGKDRTAGSMRLEAPGSAVRCSFCGKDARQGVLLVAFGLPGAADGRFGQGARVCDQCLDLCGEILAEPSPP
jgi:ClpX C4-type zinc finger